jgi:hypothetical protein
MPVAPHNRTRLGQQGIAQAHEKEIGVEAEILLSGILLVRNLPGFLTAKPGSVDFRTTQKNEIFLRSRAKNFKIGEVEFSAR